MGDVKKSHKRRSIVAIVIAAILVVIALALIGTYTAMDRAVDSMSPSGSHSTDSSVAFGAENESTYQIEYINVDGELLEAVNWDYWQNINPDVIGWVTVPGTNINYPIVQAHADDPTFYLYHDVYRNYNYRGCPYLDYRCEADGLGSLNATIFGHHLNNNTMFSAFSNFSNYSYANSHRTILLQTPEADLILDVAWVDVVNANVYENYLEFSDFDVYTTWYKSSLSQAALVLDADVPLHNYMFVTCSYNYWGNERTLVVATVRDELRAGDLVIEDQSDLNIPPVESVGTF